MKVKLVFDDWTKDGESVYNTKLGIELSMGDFHSGSTFNAEIKLNKEQRSEIEKSIAAGFHPTFDVFLI